MSEKTKRYKVVAILVIALIALAGLGYSLSAQADPNDPPIPDPDDQTPLGDGTAVVWQSVYVENIAGSSYWVNAPQPFNLLSLLGSPSGLINFKEVKSMQNNIYMNVGTPNVISWTFSCKETIAIYNSQGTAVATLVSGATVNANGQSVPVNQNIWVTGAALTGTQLQVALNNIGVPNQSGASGVTNPYTFRITLSDITLVLKTATNTDTLTSTAPITDNTLDWLIVLI